MKKMYRKIEEQLGRTINPLEYEQLNNLVEDYSINEIVECFKQYPGKPLKYIITVLKSKPKNKKPEWFDKVFEEEEPDEETNKLFDEFKTFIEDLRNDGGKNEDI